MTARIRHPYTSEISKSQNSYTRLSSRRTMLVFRALAVVWASMAFVGAAVVLSLRENALNSPDFIIETTNSDLSLFSGPRPYYTLLVLTSTDPRHECELCFLLENIVAKVSRSYFRDHFASDLVFIAKVDIVDRTNIHIFDLLGLSEIPHIWLVPPSHRIGKLEADNDSWEDKLYILKQPHLEFKLPIANENAQVMAMAQWLAETVLKPIHVEAPDGGMKYFFRNFAITFVLIFIVKKRGPRAFKNAGKKLVYSILTIAAVLLFTSGYHYTTLQKVPFVAQNEERQFIYISGGTHYQYGIETLLVAANYLALAAATLFLIFLGRYEVKPTRFIRSETVRAALVSATVVAVFLLFSCLTSIVLRKDHGYPYALARLF